MPNPEASPEPTAQVMAIGMAVRLVQAPSYLKTADPMPMLRPPDLVDTTELGQVVGLRAGGCWRCSSAEAPFCWTPHNSSG